MKPGAYGRDPFIVYRSIHAWSEIYENKSQ